MIEPKESVKNTPPAYHGAFDYDELARLGYSPDEVTDFSVNSNPYGAPKSVREAIASVPLDRYPDRECIALREKLAEHHHTNIENIVVGNGTAELLMLIAQAFIREGDKVLVVEPAFSEYQRVSELMGADIEVFLTDIAVGASLDWSEIEKLEIAVEVIQPRIVFFSNPNNPSGQGYFNRFLLKIIQKNPQTLFVSDEAYINFILSHSMMSELYPFISSPNRDERLRVVGIQTVKNVLSLRSLTKDYAIAGLRLGYVIGYPDIVEPIRRVRPAWNVNGLAQASGIAVLDEFIWMRKTIAQLHQDKDDLVGSLQDLGLSSLDSLVHYFLVNVGDATAFRSKLLQHKIMVRDCTSFGLPQYIRIATRTPEDNAKLLQAIEVIQS
ncbi:MAG: histidinol-phosphate transaminase [Chloroflexota bacterium]